MKNIVFAFGDCLRPGSDRLQNAFRSAINCIAARPYHASSFEIFVCDDFGAPTVFVDYASSALGWAPRSFLARTEERIGQEFVGQAVRSQEAGDRVICLALPGKGCRAYTTYEVIRYAQESGLTVLVC